MTREEYQLFAELAEPARSIIEYGSGGSTIYSLVRGKRVFSVDSNPDFHRFMLSIPVVSEKLGKDISLDYIDLGPTDTWGSPRTRDKVGDWPRYMAQPWTRINSMEPPVDLILVDGRFRVACFLYSLRRLHELGWPLTLLLIHDFWDRPEYQVILPFVEEHKRAGTLGAFRMKEDVDMGEVSRLISEYSLIPR